jgi:hypothetical protein
MRSNVTSEWISGIEAARRLGISAPVVPRVSAANGIRIRVLPGTYTRYHAGDIDALAARAVQLDGRRKPEAGKGRNLSHAG